MQGLLLVDKPADWTSFDMVNYVRRMVATAEGKKPKNTKVGHCGTLDPFATGLLILLVGKAYTRRASEFSKLDKTYEVTMRLGQVSTTGDPEGAITDVAGDQAIVQPTEAVVKHCLQQFVGEISQVPPAYSAIKVNGQRAYKLAREGKEVSIEPRTITIYSISLTAYSYPEISFTTEVSSGTYIRTLVQDIGQALSTGAYTTALRRTKIAQYSVNEAVTQPSLDPEIIARNLFG